MAIATFSMTNVPLNGGVKIPAGTAFTAEGIKIPFDGMDTKTLITIENTSASASPVTFVKGTGIQSVADRVISVPASSSIAVVLESGAFKNAGAVFAMGATTLKASALLLP